MDKRDSIDRIRTASFPITRRGYDKREVDHFLSRLADWLEAGGGDRAHSDTVKRELERIGQKTGKILTDAEDVAQQLREEGQASAKQTVDSANTASEQIRKETDQYAAQTRQGADAYDQKLRSDADNYDAGTRSQADAYSSEVRAKAKAYAEQARTEADQQAVDRVKAGESQAQQIVAEGKRRRADIESVIADLEQRRDTVLGEMDRLKGELTSSVGQVRPPAKPAAAKSDGGAAASSGSGSGAPRKRAASSGQKASK